MPMFRGRPVTPGQLVALKEMTRDLKPQRRRRCEVCDGLGYVLTCRPSCKNLVKPSSCADCKACDGNGTVPR